MPKSPPMTIAAMRSMLIQKKRAGGNVRIFLCCEDGKKSRSVCVSLVGRGVNGGRGVVVGRRGRAARTLCQLLPGRIAMSSSTSVGEDGESFPSRIVLSSTAVETALLLFGRAIVLSSPSIFACAEEMEGLRSILMVSELSPSICVSLLLPMEKKRGMRKKRGRIIRTVVLVSDILNV